MSLLDALACITHVLFGCCFHAGRNNDENIALYFKYIFILCLTPLNLARPVQLVMLSHYLL